jgi:hypothetical protein
VNRAQECARVICVLGLTGAIEISQGLIYGFRTEWRDLEADGIGVLIAFVAIRFWRFRSPFKWNRIATITRKERA